MGSLPHVLILLSISIVLSIYIYLYLSLYHSLYPLYLSIISLLLSLSYLFKKGKGPQSLLQIGGDWGPIETVNFFCW